MERTRVGVGNGKKESMPSIRRWAFLNRPWTTVCCDRDSTPEVQKQTKRGRDATGASGP